MTTCFPIPAQVQNVAEGVLWVRMPLPFALDHVNLWLLDDGEGWTLVDTGIGDSATCALWQHLFEGDLKGKPISRLLCTHYHPDHMGLAGWLTARFGISLTCTLGEWSYGRIGWLDNGPEMDAHKRNHYRRLGFDDSRIDALCEIGQDYRSRISGPPRDFNRIQEGDRLRIGGREWVVMTFGGHAPEHACFWCPEAGLLISGDQILPRISPVVGLWPDQPDADPLGLFLTGLERLKALPAETLVLPAHGLPFSTLPARCDELADHHRDRLGAIAALCDRPVTVAEVTQAVFTRPLDPHQSLFAAAEILAHLRHLETQGRLRRDLDQSGAWRFDRVGG